MNSPAMPMNDRYEALFPQPERGPYVPEALSPEVLDRVREEMRDSQIDVNPANLKHATEAEEIRMLLRHYGIKSMHKVAATRDGKGVVRVPFEDFRALMNAAHREGFLDGEDAAN